MRTPRAWLVGAGLAVAVPAAAVLSVAAGLLAGIPLFDGLAPPAAYRWVNPPPELRGINKAPSSAVLAVPLTPSGTASTTLETADGQVQISLPDGAFAPSPGQTGVEFRIRPLGAADAPALPPGVLIQGNAYRVDAAYQPSGVTATAAQAADIVFRYPVDATQVLLYGASGWQEVPTILESASLAVAAQTTRFGLFAAVTTGVPPSRPGRVPAWAYATAGLALMAAAAPAVLRRRSRSGGPLPA
ncbi:MAG TPA: hypothetical protein VFW71_08445 [Actinomycetota bacterium]|nr:hypothetical protein [Actinomycetota bacterium]